MLVDGDCERVVANELAVPALHETHRHLDTPLGAISGVVVAAQLVAFHGVVGQPLEPRETFRRRVEPERVQ
jgi:hypothetical protein